MTTPSLPAPLAELRRNASAWWRALALRDRRLVTLAGVVAAAALLWGLAVQPALRTLREVPPAIERLDAESQRMQLLAAESRTLRSAPPVTPTQAAAALKAAAERLDEKARLVVQGERATVKLTGVDGAALRSFLAEARASARARPVEAQLVRGPKGYDGTLILAIGGRP